jgi:hypothetical protein
MALPVNKQKLDAAIITNLPNNSEQLITAEKLRNTLTPIVNSTYGLKTIWAGKVWLNTGWARATADRVGWYIIENYCDPNYFAPYTDPTSPSNPLSKYVTFTLGSNLLADNGTPNGTFTNKNVTNVDSGFGGYGLTFDGVISSGRIDSLSVNNPGAGYMYGFQNGSPTYVQKMTLNLSVSSGGSLPVIEFNLSNTISAAFNDTQTYSNGWSINSFNVFIPNKTTTIGPSEVIVLNWTDARGANATIEKSLSRIGEATNNITIGDLRPSEPGFYFNLACQTDSTTNNDKITTGYLEIKVPIINTTLPV